MTPTKRGRPPSEATIEKRRIEEFLKNPPAHIPPMNEGERRVMDSMLDSLNKAEREILRQYRTSPNIPKSHAYEMASLGDESLQGFESEIIARDQQYQLDAETRRFNGGLVRENEANGEAHRLAGANKDLVKEIQSGQLTIGRAAQKIHDRWSTRGVPSKGKNKDKRPSLRTIKRHLTRATETRS